MSSTERLPTFFIPHGGGPCFFIDGAPPFNKATWGEMERFLRGLLAGVSPRPKAILVVSGHWDAAKPTVNTARTHSLYYDYYGFPEHTYRLNYPAKGSPELAARVRTLLADAGVETAEEPSRGLDHGVFVPFLLVAPEADIPLVQLSLTSDMDPAAHLRIGEALSSLRDEGVLIIGSGMSYHNLKKMFSAGAADGEASEFDVWLTDAIEDSVHRDEKLTHWRAAPSAIACHPEAEHLLPLHVAAGAAAGDAGKRIYSDKIMGKAVSAYRFG